MTTDVNQQANTENTALLVIAGRKTAAIPLASVVELLPACAVTPVYELPDRVLGVFNYHGVVIPVIDLARILLEPGSVLHPRQRFVLCQSHTGTLAILVDEVGDVIGIDEACSFGFASAIPSAFRFTVVAGDVIPVVEPACLLPGADESHPSSFQASELFQIQQEVL